MVYSISWDETTPDGSENANTIDTEIRQLKEAISERIVQVIPDWDNDGVDPKLLAVLDVRARISRSSAQVIPNATLTSIDFVTEDVDVGEMSDLGTDDSILTIPVGEGGLYLIGGYVHLAGHTGTYSQALMTAGGSVVCGQSSHTNVNTIDVRLSFHTLISLSAADTMFIQVGQNSGGNVNLNAASMYALKVI